jgi:hypothetical protein
MSLQAESTSIDPRREITKTFTKGTAAGPAGQQIALIRNCQHAFFAPGTVPRQ